MINLSLKRNLLAFVLFVFITILFTYPLALRIKSVIPGYGTTDEPLAGISYLWTVKYFSLHKLDLKDSNFLAYPFGMNFEDYTGTTYFWQLIKNTLTSFVNEAFAVNFLVLLSFILSGWFTYLLVYYISESNFVALFSGLIFAFSPYHFSRAWQHLSLSQIQLLPLYLFSLFLLKEKPGRKSFIFMVIVLFFLVSINFYYAYFMVFATLTFMVWYFLSKTSAFKAKLKFWLLLVFVCLVVLVLISPSLLEIYKEKGRVGPDTPLGFNIMQRSFEDLFSQSARPLSYFLPATVHPVFGGFTENFLGSSLYGESLTEHALYLGWVPLILAFVAFRRWWKSRKGKLASLNRFYIGYFCLLAVVAWFLSQPPWWNILGFRIYMPSFFLYKILPMFRAYCRFGIVVMLAVAALAGFGLKFILDKFKTRKPKIAITAIFCGLVLFEFWNWPPYKVINVSKAPAVYYWLKGKPSGIVIAEYPLDADSPNVMYMFYQTKHEKRIINGALPGTHAYKFAQTITKLSDPHTAGILKRMGVKYVLVHREDYLKTGLTEEIEELRKIPDNHSLKFIKGFPAEECPQKDIICLQETGPIDVYEVAAQPEKSSVQ